MKMQILVAMLFLTGNSFGQSGEAAKAIQTGNDHYKQKRFEQAMAAYTRALQADPSNESAKFNLGNAEYKQDKKDEATKIFTEVANSSSQTDMKEKAWYNNGVVLSRQKKLEESIEAYKNALRQNPDDKDARENLQKALLELKKKNPPEKKKDQDKKKQQDQQKQQKQQQSKMSPKEAEQRLKLLEQKEKEVQQRLQKAKAQTGGGQAKDW
jgi:Ca-activated chloride channel family protein